MNTFFTLKYWFNPRPGALVPFIQNTYFVFLLLLLILIVVSIIFKKRKGLYRKFWEMINTFAVTNLIIGLFYYFFIYELTPMLSSRFWFLVWGAVIGVWTYFIVKHILQIPKIKTEREKEKEFKKYLP